MDIQNKYVQRLFEEWKTHGKIIIAVDYDDTISPWKLNGIVDCVKVINLLKECSLVGAYIVVFTACHIDRYTEIEQNCILNGLPISGINKNPIDLPYGNVNKIYANIFVDDRAGIEESIQILSNAMYLMRSHKAGQLLNNPGSTEF